jgi:hypothetical protein
MRFVKRRDPACRPAIKPAAIILLDGATRAWRDRVKALKAAQDADQNKEDTGIVKQNRP